MEAIGTFYNNNSELTVSHMIVMWLVHDKEGPMEKLCEALNATGEHEIAVQLTHLSSLGKEQCAIECTVNVKHRPNLCA